MKKIINKTLFAGLSFGVISFLLWSLVFTQIFAKENTENVLGTEIISPLADNWQPIQINPSPSPDPSITPSVKPTNSPTPKPTSSSKPSSSPVSIAQLDEWFAKYANKESVDQKMLKQIAECESKYNPQATNGIYAGLFQFSKNTWISTRISMNENIDPDLRFDPHEAIKTAAFRLATSGIKAWPNCSK